VIPNLGVEFSSKLEGSYRPGGDGGDQPLRLELTGRLANLMQALFSPRAEMRGTVTLPGLADGRPVQGELEVQPLRSARLRLSFDDDQGAACQLEARQDFAIGDALRGRSMLEGTLRRGDQALGQVRFELDLLSSLGQFWGSVRPAPPAPR
jgi:hypothetical protein